MRSPKLAISQRLHDPKVAFGNQLRLLRSLANLSQEKLAEKAFVDRTYVSSCERGKRNVSLEIIVRLAAALQVLPSELLAGIQAARSEK